MLNKIIKFSLENRLFVTVIFLLLTIAGIYITADMEVDVFPDLTAPTVVVLTEAHGMAPEEVERLVTFPIETAINGATDVRRVRSSSSMGISIVWVEFDWGTNIFNARQIVSEKLLSITEKLPTGVGTPTLSPQSSIMGEIMLIGITADSTNLMDLRTIADWNIRQRLLAVEGVSQVMVIGGEYKQYQILADPYKMKFYNVSLNELYKAGKGLNQNSSGGFINELGKEYIVNAVARTNNIDEIAQSFIKVVDGYSVKIEDVAEIKIAPAPKIGDGFVNKKMAVILTVQKQPNTNTLELTKKIDEELSEIKKTLHKDIQINSHIFRQSDFIEAAINNITRALLEGSLFVIVILILFLMNYRATIISVVAIPISLLVSIIALKLLGLTINTMSLGGMAIAIGSLVDDAIIDVDNVLKRLKENIKKPVGERANPLIVIYNASTEIRASILNATIIIVIAFIPLFFLSGMEGRLLKPLGIAYIVSLFASLIVAVTLTPVMCSYLFSNSQVLENKSKEGRLAILFKNIYGKTLDKVLGGSKQSNIRILATAFALFIIALIALLNLGRSFLPEFNEGSLVPSTVSMPGISLDESNKLGKEIEEALLSFPEIRAVTRRTGRSELDEHAQGVYSSELDAPFELKDRNRDEFMKAVREKLSGITGVNVTIGQPLGHRIDHMLSGTRANIAIKVFGEDLNTLYYIGNKIKNSIQSVEGLVDLSVEQQVEIPQVQIKPIRSLLARYGIPINDFTEFVDIAFNGEKLSEVYEGEKKFDLVLKYDADNSGKIDLIRNTLIDTYDGRKAPLNYVAEVTSATGPHNISRENVHRKLVVSANVSGRDLRGVIDDIKSRINNDIKLTEGYSIDYGGQFESEQKASSILLITSLIAILIIYLILYQEFRSAQISLIILINLPLALIGGVFMVAITSGTLNIPAIIGFITLFGIAIRNGILLISHYNTLLNEGCKLKDAVFQGSIDRLNPILMTALTAALALAPLALEGSKPGNEIQSPMAIVILGGLLSSTFLNLVIVPLIYYIYQKNRSEKTNAEFN